MATVWNIQCPVCGQRVHRAVTGNIIDYPHKCIRKTWEPTEKPKTQPKAQHTAT